MLAAGKAAIGAAILALSAGPGAIVSPLHAAPQEAQPAFEVASVKHDLSDGPKYIRWFPDFHAERLSLTSLVVLAYQVHDFQLTGGPGWIASEPYSIDAKSDARPVAGQEHVTIQRQRLQALLRNRFHLAIHREPRELPFYELTVAKGGPKLQPAGCTQRETGDTTIAPGKSQSDYCGPTALGKGRIDSPAMSIAFLANILSDRLSRAVVDKTGIAGDFHMRLTWAPALSSQSPNAVPAPADGAAAADTGPDLFTAIQDQLGLKLVSARGPVEILVIDSVEKPSQN